MKKLFIGISLFLGFFLVGCNLNSQSTTTEESIINTSIYAPVISISGNLVIWNEVDGVESYEVYVVDDTTPSLTDTLVSYKIPVSTNSFDLDTLDQNRVYKVYVRSVIGNEHSELSNSLTISSFVNTSIDWEYPFNPNSLDDFALYLHEMPAELYFIVKDLGVVSTNNYYFNHEMLFIDNDYLQTFEDQVELKLYTEIGIINLVLSYTEATRPSILSSNTFEFIGLDPVFVFDLCGGEITSVTSSVLDSNDYTIDGNLLIIDSQALNDYYSSLSSPTTIILNYELRAGSEIVLGVIYINAAEGEDQS